MKTIIVPTDFSPIADNAMNFAVAMAQHINASLMLLHVFQLPVSVTEVPMPAVSMTEMQEVNDKKLADMKEVIDKMSSGQLKVYTEARLGDVVDELEDICKKIHPFAVVMAANRTSGIEKLVFGSTTLTTIKHLHVPVLVIPPGAKFAPIQKIGLACDFKDIVAHAPDREIKAIVKEFNAELHVLNVDHENRHYTTDTPEEALLMQDMLADLQPQFHFIDKEDIEEGLNAFAEENNLDFLIVIPRKHKLLDGLFHKSHTKEMIFHSHVPVMAIHEE